MSFWTVLVAVITNLPALVGLIKDIVAFIEKKPGITLDQVISDLSKAYQQGLPTLMNLLHPPTPQ